MPRRKFINKQVLIRKQLLKTSKNATVTLKVDSYIKDTTDFLHKLNSLGQLQPETLLGTIDAVSLYTNIPHKDSIRAAKHVLKTRPVKEPHTWVLLRLLHFILKKQPSNSMTNCMSKYPEQPWERNVLQTRKGLLINQEPDTAYMMEIYR